MRLNAVPESDEVHAPMTYNELHDVAQYLYGLLDDIDTAGDIAKADNWIYRKIVERIQAKKRVVVASCDGYTVKLKPLAREDQ